MTILLIISMVFCFSGIIWLSFRNELKDWEKILVPIIIVVGGILYGMWTIYSGDTFNKKHYNVTQKIEQKVIDGKIIKSDTLFVLTRKK